MWQKQLGNTDVKISALGLGTWKYGVNPDGEVKALKAGFELGLKFVDTAEMYNSEDIVGRAISGKKGIFVATKVSPNHFHYDDVIKACDSSLSKLGIKTIDLYQLHWPNPGIRIKETMEAMEELVRQKKIKYIGVSNFSVEETKDAQNALKENRIVSNQVEYNVLVRNVEDELLDYCVKEKITIIAYSPLARGMLFERKYADVRAKLGEVGRRYNKTVAQVALNWLLMKEPVVAIPKAGRKEHVAEIAGAADFKLKGNDIDELNRFLSITE